MLAVHQPVLTIYTTQCINYSLLYIGSVSNKINNHIFVNPISGNLNLSIDQALTELGSVNYENCTNRPRTMYIILLTSITCGLRCFLFLFLWVFLTFIIASKPHMHFFFIFLKACFSTKLDFTLL